MLYSSTIVISEKKKRDVLIIIITIFVVVPIWLFNIAMKITMLLIGKPSISMGHLYHSYVTNYQMVSHFWGHIIIMFIIFIIFIIIIIIYYYYY